MNSHEFNFIGKNKPYAMGCNQKRKKRVEDDEVERERKGLREGGQENRKGQARDGEGVRADMTKENMDKERRIDKERERRREEGESNGQRRRCRRKGH